MPARKKYRELPDHRPPRHTIRQAPDGTALRDGKKVTEPTLEAISQIATKHNFPPTFDLFTRLQQRWEWWQIDVNSGPRKPAEAHRNFLRALADRVRALEEALERAGAVERRAVRESAIEANLDFDVLRRQLRFLRLGATAGARTIPDSKPGRHGDAPLGNLLCQLYRIWRKAFGPGAPRISNNLGIYGQGFFAFADDVLKSFGVTKSNAALGKAVEKAIRIVEQKIKAGKLSPE